MDLTMLACVRCGGRQFLTGVQPRRQTRDEMERDLAEKGKVHAICTHCGRISTLKPSVEVKS